MEVDHSSAEVIRSTPIGIELFQFACGQDAFVHHALGFSFVELGETGDSVRAWLRTLEIDPTYDFARFGRVKIVNRR